jgi:hypothetical protein
MNYSFYNSGTFYFFKPNRPAFDVREQKRMTALEFHTKLVKEANRPDVFICNEHGQIIVEGDVKPTHVPMAEYNRLFRKKTHKKK